jgi:hypothetical protein
MAIDDYYSPELEAHDPYFDRATQADIARQMLAPFEECIEFDPNDPESRARVLGEKAVGVQHSFAFVQLSHYGCRYNDSRGCRMSEEERAMAAAQSCDYGYAPTPKIRLVVSRDSDAAAQPVDDDDDYPTPYSEEMAQRWAKEDPDFDIEGYRRDPYFTKENQAMVRRAIARVKAGKHVTVACVDGKRVSTGA